MCMTQQQWGLLGKSMCLLGSLWTAKELLTHWSLGDVEVILEVYF